MAALSGAAREAPDPVRQREQVDVAWVLCCGTATWHTPDHRMPRHKVCHKETPDMADEPIKRYAPYLAWRTFFNLILQLDEKGLPTRIDRSFLSQRSGLDQGYLIATLKAFGMIAEDGTVLEPLKDLVAAGEGRPPIVADLLKAHYPEVFALPTNATQAQLDDVFRDVFGQSGATLRKSETFFLHGATFAGLKLSPYFKAPRGVQGGASTTRRPRKRTAPRGQTAPVITDPADKAAPSTESPADEMRLRYFDVLLKKVDGSGETDADLLDRIERLIGVERSQSATSTTSRPQPTDTHDDDPTDDDPTDDGTEA